jgi:hypothetical protein
VAEILDWAAGEGFGLLMEEWGATEPVFREFHTAQEYRQRYLLGALRG